MSASWNLATVAAANLQLPLNSTQAVIELLEKENTVPFIARYRREVTGALDENEIRKIDRERRRLSYVHAEFLIFCMIFI